MMWSHIAAVVSKPGYLPKHYKELDHASISKDSNYWKIIKVREEMHSEVIVRRKLRKKELQTFEESYANINESRGDL